MKKENKGITLIALAITIIVLLILAGVTITTLTGDNGLLEKANQAKTATEKSAAREEIDLLLLQAKMGDKLEDIFKSGTVTKDGGIYEVSYKGNDFLITSDYKYVEKIEPAYEGEWTFNETTQTLTAYNGDLTTKRGNQEVGELIIPNYYNGKRVKIIKEFILENNTNLTKLTISEGIEKIYRNAFSGCSNLSDLKIPNSLIRMEMAAFQSCSALEGQLKLGDNLEYIGAYAFYSCSKLTGNLIIPDSVTTIGGQSFQGCTGLNGNLKLGKNLEYIGAYAFYSCNSLTGDLIIPDNVTEIGDYAFWGCKGLNGNLQIGKSVQKIGADAFWDCPNLTGDVVMPESLEKIGQWAFIQSSSLNSIKFLNRNTQIYDDSNTIKSTIKIIGYEGSTAEGYATKYDRTFETITE